MNIAFTRLLKVRGLLREFNFRKNAGTERSYHVDTTNERGMRYLFTMKGSEEGSWILASTELPAWICEAEGIIAAAIEEEASFRSAEHKRTA